MAFIVRSIVFSWETNDVIWLIFICCCCAAFPNDMLSTGVSFCGQFSFDWAVLLMYGLFDSFKMKRRPTKNNNGNRLSDFLPFFFFFDTFFIVLVCTIHDNQFICGDSILNTLYIIWQIAHTSTYRFVIWSKYIKTMSMDIFLSVVINCVSYVLNCLNRTSLWSISIDRWAGNAVSFLLLFCAPRITNQTQFNFQTVKERNKSKKKKMNYTLSRILGKDFHFLFKTKYVA